MKLSAKILTKIKTRVLRLECKDSFNLVSKTKTQNEH